jgi:O-antigen ligase
MNIVSINARKFLGEYIDAQNREWQPEELLFGGLLLFAMLLTIFCLIGGMITLVTVVTVLILGSGVGIVLTRYRRFTILSCISGIVSLSPLGKRSLSKAA